MDTDTSTPRPAPPGGRGQRNWQLAFALYSVVAATMVWLRRDAPHPSFQSAAVVGYALAAPLTAICAWALGRQGLATRARRTLISFHLLFIPLQFFFLLAHKVPFAGMLLSSMIVVRMRPRFPQLRRRSRKVWLTLHVGVSVGWLGLSLAMATLAIVGANADDHVLRHGAYELMHVFDLAIVIPSAAAAILTGVVVAVGTPWGLVKHWWVMTKFVIALALPLIATVESGWIAELRQRTEDPGGRPAGLGLALVVCMLLFVSLLWTAVLLSIFKPGGRTRWGRRPAPRRTRGAGAYSGPQPMATPDRPQVRSGVGPAYRLHRSPTRDERRLPTTAEPGPG